MMYYSRFLHSGIAVYPKDPPRDELYWSTVEVDYNAPCHATKGWMIVKEDGSRFDRLFDWPLESGINEASTVEFHTVKIKGGWASKEDVVDHFIVFESKGVAQQVAETLVGNHKIIPVEFIGEKIGATIFGKRCTLVKKVKIGE